MITDIEIAVIEARISKQAEKVAYEVTESCEDRELQTWMYKAIKSYIIYGARLFQEELLNLKNDE